MPIARFEMPDGRIGRFEVPEGTSPEQAQALIAESMQPQPAAEKSTLDKGMGLAKEFVMRSPIGAAMRLGGIGDAPNEVGGLITDALAGKVSPEAAAGVGYAANVGMQVVPTLLGGMGAQTAGKPVMEAGAKRLMRSAVKPEKLDVMHGNAVKAIDTMLEDGINATPGGMAKLRAKITSLNEEIMEAIRNSPATVDKYAAGRTLRDLVQNFTKQVNPKSDVSAIRSAWREFLDHPLLQGKTDIPVQLAQEMKQGTYRALGSKPYGELQGAASEAQKTLARGLKEGIAGAVPEVAGLNAAESKLLNSLDVVEKRVLMSLNNNPGGLAWLTTDPAKMAAFLADRSPAFKSIVARILYSSSEALPRTAGQVVGAGVGATAGQD